MVEKCKLKSVIKHEVTELTETVKVYSSYFSRYVSVDSVFDIINLDNIDYYEFKNLTNNRYWKDNKLIENLYKYNSLFMGFYFREQELPTRCIPFYETLVEEFTSWLLTFKGKVFKSKVQTTVRHFIKHVSRLHYHNKFTLIYPKDKSHWKKDKRLSSEYMRSLVEYLQSNNKLKEYTGYQIKSGNVTSMLVIKPDFILRCNGGLKDQVNMEECLKVTKVRPLISITEREDLVEGSKTYNNKIVRKMTKEEKIVADELSEVLKAYNDFLATKMITVNGVSIPELFFTRVFSSDLNGGGRYYDDGSIQHESKTIRDTILIDGEETVELDYKGLHYSIAASLLGVDLKGKDPYDFEYPVDLDNDLIREWEKEHEIPLPYDPVRNLKKTALLVLFNADSYQGAVKAISKSILDDYRKEDKLKRRLVGIKNVKVKPLLDAVISNNREVSEYFLTGVWKDFQNKDSRMMDYCVKRFIERGEVCIPVHDSLIVKKSLYDFGKVCMEDAYEDVLGTKLNCVIN